MPKTSKHNLYTGRSGQLAVMSIFLNRGYNVAIPEVDVGDDIFVVRDTDGNLTRIQVKSALAKGTARRYGDFQLSTMQLERVHEPELVYVFALHYDGLWRDYLVIERLALKGFCDNQGIGRLNRSGTRLTLRLSFGATDVTCEGADLQLYRKAWEAWPVIEH